jgi:hypothetical protein
MTGALTATLPLDDFLATALSFEVGVLDNFYAWSKEQILDALNELDEASKNRLLEIEALAE